MKITTLQNNLTLAAATSTSPVAAPLLNSGVEGGVIKIGQLSSAELSSLREYGQRIESDFESLIPTVRPMPPKTQESTETGESDPVTPRSGPEMTPRRAAEILLKNLKYLDTASGSKDGVFGYADLKALGDSPLLSAELKAAVGYLQNNPAVFRAFDVAGEKHGSPTDGRINAADLEAYLADNDEKGWGESPAEWTPETVAETLLRYYSLFDTAAGTDTQGGPLILPGPASKGAGISLLDLGAMIHGNPNLPEDLKKAAELLKSSPAIFNAMETAVSAKDGKITKKDLQAFLGQDVGPDGPEVDPPDVDPVGPDYSKMSPNQVAETFLKYFDLIDSAGVKEGNFQLGELNYILGSNANLPDELKQAIAYVQRNPMVMNAFDVARSKGDKFDGRISALDLKRYLGANAASDWNTDSESSVTPVKDYTPGLAAQVLLNYFSVLDTATGQGKRDLLIGKAELVAVLKNNKDVPADLRHAIEYLQSNEAVFNLLDSAGDKKGKNDGLIGLRDLEKIANG